MDMGEGWMTDAKGQKTDRWLESVILWDRLTSFFSTFGYADQTIARLDKVTQNIHRASYDKTFYPPPPKDDNELTAITMDSALHSADKGNGNYTSLSQGEVLSIVAQEAMKYLMGLPEAQQKQITHMMWQTALERTIDASASTDEL